MKFTIDEDVVSNTSTVDGVTLTLEEVLACLLNQVSDNGIDVINNLIDRGIIIQEQTMFYTRLKPFRKYQDLVKKILLMSDQSIPQSEELLPLAKKLKEIYPKGRREGTTDFWQDSLTATIDRLKGLYKHFPEVKQYSNEQIVEATKKYIDMFGLNRRYMRMLNYFLWKKRDDSVTSDLLKILENPDVSATDFYDNAEMI